MVNDQPGSPSGRCVLDLDVAGPDWCAGRSVSVCGERAVLAGSGRRLLGEDLAGPAPEGHCWDSTGWSREGTQFATHTEVQLEWGRWVLV